MSNKADNKIVAPCVIIELSRWRKIEVCRINDKDTFWFSFWSEYGLRHEIALTREAVWGMRLAVETLDDATNIKARIV